ncbi:MAG: hypothetical protein JF611_06870 [Betaproteobacteria bacterium]|nr:hypothetical protein [Betaproteobacteria bacterium]
MKLLAWLLIIACFASLWWGVTRWRKGLKERDAASEARFAALLAQAKPGAGSASSVAAAPAAASPPRASPPALPPGAVAREERLLVDAATKAGEAGEPVLAIQLYARLLSRFPQTSFAAYARSAVAELKKKVAKT